jgi:hypothetical protein
MLVAEIIFSWWGMHICQHVYVVFVLPQYCSQVTPHPSSYVTPFQFECLSKVNRHSFSIWPDRTTAIDGLGMEVIINSAQEKKLSM